MSLKSATLHFGGREYLQEEKLKSYPLSQNLLTRLRDPPLDGTREKNRAVLGESGIEVAKSLLPKFWLEKSEDRMLAGEMAMVG